MKLLQLNIWEGKLLKEILSFIEKEQPDILCLQEVYSCKGDIKLPDFMFDSLERIIERTGYQHSFFTPVFTTIYADVPASFGIAILSRYPLENQQSIFTNGEYIARQTATNYIPNSRVLQWCQVVADDKTFSLANHHGHLEVDPLGSQISIEKMQFVKAKLEYLPQPLIFSGDLNIKGESPAMRVFDGFLTDLTATNQIPTTLSQFGKVANVACDHILVSDDVNVKDFHVTDDLVSDHKALVLEFDL